MNRKYLICFFALLLSAAAAYSQTPGTTSNPTDNPTGPTSNVDPPIPPAIQAELEAMKARIAELEREREKRSDELGGDAAQVPPQGAPSIPQALEEPAAGPVPDTFTPFAYGDFTWLNGYPRNKKPVFDTKFFTPEVRFDTHFMNSFNHPKDHSLGGSTESFRSGEVQLEQVSVGGDFHWQNVRGRLLSMFGLFAFTTPRNDASTNVGQWSVDTAYRYFSEAWGGYHFDVNHGLNVDAGIFVSYIGLFSYYNFDNWTYQPSFVSSNTPWFFNGLRIQWFPTNKLKIEPWIINGWQSYGMFNSVPGWGAQILWRPTANLSLLSNDYYGHDLLNTPSRARFHTDNSIEYKYYDRPNRMFDKGAFSITADLGCESGGGVSCISSSAASPAQNFKGYMIYNRAWFDHDLYGVTIGGGAMSNPGRYLVLLPPINGATAFSGTPYFTENPGNQFSAWDASVTFDYMPDQFATFRGELDYRHSSVPYFSGPGGVTPLGGNTGAPQSLVPGFSPDLRTSETRLNFALLVKF